MPDQTSAAFISYCRADQEFALRLAQDLKDAGAAVWLDQLDIIPGHPWDNAVKAPSAPRPKMLVILTPTSVSSENVRDEIAYALKQGKIVIPVYIWSARFLCAWSASSTSTSAPTTAAASTYFCANSASTTPTTALDRAADGDVQRQLAWQAREAEAEQPREIAAQP